MYKILIISILATLLSASNPKIYAALGDVIYDNADNIEKLQNLEVYSDRASEIKEYIEEVNSTKEIGFKIELDRVKPDKKEYLIKLRELSKLNDSFVRSAKANYKNSLKNNNSLVFSQMINSGFIDTVKNKEEIIDYYFLHSDDINASGVIQSYLDEDIRLKAKRDALAKKYKSKKMREAEKIKRIRENDKEAQEKLEKMLQDEVNKKKIEIREHQKKELTK